MNYTPRPGSLAAHACAWFKTNPTRKLTAAQICGRFGGTAQTAAAQLGAAEDAEFLLCERIGRNDVYSAGPKLNLWTPLPDSTAAAAAFNPPPVESAGATLAAPASAPASTKLKPTRQRLPPLDIAALQVQTGALVEPRLGGPHAKDRTMYGALFDKLAQPNSFVEVPAAYVPSLQKAATIYRKKHPTRVLRFVKVSDTKHQVQRLADKAAGA